MLAGCGPVLAQTEQTVTRPQTGPDHADPSSTEPWLDRAQNGLYRSVWRSAMHVDRLFGSDESEEPYTHAYGSIAPALLWDEFDGFDPQVRFRVSVPLPQINERFNAFIGRVNPEEFVTESAPQSGAFPRQYGPPDDDDTLFGIIYRDPEKQGSHFDASAGLRVRSPLDPYIKGSYVFERGSYDRLLFGFRQTLFWRNSENLGLTTRFDVAHIVNDAWLVRWTTSGTISQESHGLRGYGAVNVLRGFPSRRAIAFEVGFDGSTDALVPMHEYGMKAAYRQSIVRDWLVIELRTSLTWPKDLPEQPRKPSWGVGLGFEMFFGDQDFLARPATF